jgi:hypothetical protein
VDAGQGRATPLLLQTGETYQGTPLHDRQHPHDLAMELSTTFEQKLAGPVSASLYLAAVGEPAAGPVPSCTGRPPWVIRSHR